MLTVNTKVKKSKIHGKGLFAAEKIEKGRPVWKQYGDLIVDTATFAELKEFYGATDFLTTYATQFKDGSWYLDLDGCRYMNHSNDPNIVFIGTYGFAVKDINKGEELTCDYSTITTSEHLKILLRENENV